MFPFAAVFKQSAWIQSSRARESPRPSPGTKDFLNPNQSHGVHQKLPARAKSQSPKPGNKSAIRFASTWDPIQNWDIESHKIPRNVGMTCWHEHHFTPYLVIMSTFGMLYQPEIHANKPHRVLWTRNLSFPARLFLRPSGPKVAKNWAMKVVITPIPPHDSLCFAMFDYWTTSYDMFC